MSQRLRVGTLEAGKRATKGIGAGSGDSSVTVSSREVPWWSVGAPECA